MNRYILVIYHDPLSDFECEQISGLFYGAKVEKILQLSAHAITCGQAATYDYSSIGYCYRIHTDEAATALGYFGKETQYIGRFDNELESQCVKMGDLWLKMSDEFLSIDEWPEQIQSIAQKYQSIMGKEADLDLAEVEKIEEQYRELLDDISVRLYKLFEAHAIQARPP